MAGALGFLADGFREVGRKANRMSLRRQLASQDQERRQALSRLGQTAWEAKVDLTDLADLRGRLEELDARAGDLSAAATRLDSERTALQAKRQEEASRFDGLLSAARTALSEADAAVRAARTTLSEKEKALKTLETQLAGLPQDQLEQRQTLTDQLAAATAARAPLVEDLTARSADSQRRAAEVTRIDGERKAALQPIDADLARVQQQASAATRDRTAVGRDQSDRFRELGDALYGRQPAHPALNECLQAVAAVDARRGATQGTIDSSLALTSGMPPGTMAKFWTVALLIPAMVVAAYVVYVGGISTTDSLVQTPARLPITAPAIDAAKQRAAEEQRKDELVQAFLRAPGDESRRKDAVPILTGDMLTLGSTADRTLLPMLVKVVERGDPELRAAAAQAVGMIGPSATEIAVLVKALNDPIPVVRDAVAGALERANDDATRLLVYRARSSASDSSRSEQGRVTPTVVPDAGRLGMAIYPAATFLAYASDPEAGRFAFSSTDPVQTIVDFYAKAAKRGPVGAEEFTRLYFGGSPDDPTGAKAMNAGTEAWLKQAVAAGTPDSQIQAEAERRAKQMLRLPLLRYREAILYGAPVFLATEVASSNGATRVVRYAVVFEDHSVGSAGFELHLPVDSK